MEKLTNGKTKDRAIIILSEYYEKHNLHSNTYFDFSLMAMRDCLKQETTELQDKLKQAVDCLHRINKLKPLWIYSDNLAEDPQWAVEAEAINNMAVDIAEVLTKLTDK